MDEFATETKFWKPLTRDAPRAYAPRMFGFGKKKRKASPHAKARPRPSQPRTRQRLVSVCFRDLLSAQPTSSAGAYTYKWNLAETPKPGMRVMVPGMDGLAPAVIHAVNVKCPDGFTVSELESVGRLVTDQEVSAAQQDMHAWFDMARHAAGLPTPGKVRSSPPSGFDPIPPIKGHASAQRASNYGRVWWKLYKQSESYGRPPEESQRFRAIADYWYDIRDQLGGR